MKTLRSGRLAWLVLAAPLLIAPAACTVGPGYGYGNGYDAGPNIGIGVDYYEPLGFDYGGWGPGYRVGPPRGGPRGFGGGGRSGSHAYRSAPAGHSMPSIPSGPRGGGGRGDGGRGGGGGHR